MNSVEDTSAAPTPSQDGSRSWPKWLTAGILGAYAVVLAQGMGSAFALAYARHLGVPSYLVEIKPLDVYRAVSFNFGFYVICLIPWLGAVTCAHRTHLIVFKRPLFSDLSGVATTAILALLSWSLLIGLFRLSSLLYTMLLCVAEVVGLLLLAIGLSKWRWLVERVSASPASAEDRLSVALKGPHTMVVSAAVLLSIVLVALAERTGQYFAEDQGAFISYEDNQGIKHVVVYKCGDLLYTYRADQFAEGKIPEGSILSASSVELKHFRWEILPRKGITQPPIAYLRKLLNTH